MARKAIQSGDLRTPRHGTIAAIFAVQDPVLLLDGVRRVLGRAFSWRHAGADLAALVQPAPGNVAGLDMARSAAVLLVICHHFAYEWRTAGLPAVAIFKAPMFHWGWTGVDLFFVLSGCLIGQQLWREFTQTGRVRVLRFLGKRGLRIWPLYFSTLIVLALIGSRFAPLWPDWLLVSNYFSGLGYIRGWSLSTEEHFYIFVPLMFVVAGRWRSKALAASAFAACLLVVPIFRAIAAANLRSQGVRDSIISDRLYTSFHLHAEALFVGMLLAFLYTQVTERDSRRTRATQWALVAAAVIGVALRAYDKIVFPYLALALIYGSVVWFLWNAQGVVDRVARVPIFHAIARLSFGMYLNHLIDANAVPRAVSIAAMLTSSVLAQCALGLVMVTLQSALLALVSYVVVEQPWLRTRAALFPATRTPAFATPATSASPLPSTS